MTTDQERPEYVKPEVVDFGTLAELTAAGFPAGHFDADYQQGQPIPPGGAGTQP